MRISWLMKLHIWIRLKWFNSHPLNFISFKFWHALVQILSLNLEVVCSKVKSKVVWIWDVISSFSHPQTMKGSVCLSVTLYHHPQSTEEVLSTSMGSFFLWLRIIPNSEFLVLTLSTTILVRYWVQDRRIPWIVFLLFHWAQESKVGSQQEGIVMNLMRRGRN